MKVLVGVATLVTLAVPLAAPAPVAALELTGEGTLIAPAFLPEIGDEVNVLFVNHGEQAVRVEMRMLRADDLSEVATSGSSVVAKGTGLHRSFIPSDFPVLIVVRFRAQGTTHARVSLQVVDPTGATKIFTDGFESGDLTL